MCDVTLHVIATPLASFKRSVLVFSSIDMGKKKEQVKVETSKMQYISGSFSPWMTQRGMCEDIIDRP